jgi:hypothetical protein
MIWPFFLQQIQLAPAISLSAVLRYLDNSDGLAAPSWIELPWSPAAFGRRRGESCVPSPRKFAGSPANWRPQIAVPPPSLPAEHGPGIRKGLERLLIGH